MKKIVSLVCVAALAVSMLAGCSSKKEETKAAETTTAATEESAGEKMCIRDRCGTGHSKGEWLGFFF